MHARRHGNRRTGLLNACGIVLAIALLATACSSDPDPDADHASQTDREPAQGDPDGGASSGSDATTETTAIEVTTVTSQGPGGDAETDIFIELGDAADDDGLAPDDSGAPRETTVQGTALDEGDTDALLDRLPELDADEADQVEFRLPVETRPRPRPLTTVDGVFPPAGSGEVPAGEVDDPGPLQVLRFQPEGPVDLAPFISVTFNQPMVALSTVSQVEAADVPITITPEMPGRFIWLGARTVRFEYEPGAIDRIPAATDYLVEIPAGTRAANGATLDDDVSFSFTTPAATVVDVAPMHSALPTEPIFFIEFDQRVDPEAIVAVTTIEADGDRVDIMLAGDEEVVEDDSIAHRVSAALPGRWVAVRPTEPLPTDAEIVVTVGPDIPSAEGPGLNAVAHRESGRTYGPLNVDRVECGWVDECLPGQAWTIGFTNPLDAQAFRADQVTIEPELARIAMGVDHDQITIRGLSRGSTRYDITLAADITDIYGQRLGDVATATVQVDRAPSALFRPQRTLVTLDPIVADNRLNVTTINNDQLAVHLYQVDPVDDWVEFQENSWQLTRNEWTPDWPRVHERIIDTQAADDEFTEVAIDLGQALDATGHVVAVVAPPRGDDDWANQPIAVWVQRTTVGLDATTDNQRGVAWVTDLRTGEALPGAEITMISRSGSTDVGRTDVDGIATFDLGIQVQGLLADVDGDRALVGDFWAERWDDSDQARWYVVDDRGIYKPGETARLKGWVRQAEAETPARLTLPREGATVSWAAHDNFGNLIAEGEATLSALGGFDFEVELPIDITLGAAGVEFSTNAFDGTVHRGWHELRIQEFRRPDFEVGVELVDAEPHFAGDDLTVAANADYFAGGALAGSEVNWQVNGHASSYQPPNWPAYNWGIWVPWWFDIGFARFDDFGEPGFGDPFGFGGVSETWAGVTDAAGQHDLRLNVRTDGKPRPVSVTATATVFDVNRQPITGSTRTLIHPADVYVGLRGPRNFVAAGQPIDVDMIVTDLDGVLAPGHDVTVTSTRLEWQFVGGSWTEVPVADGSCELTSIDGPTTCSLEPSSGGRYRIAATVTDAAGRTNLTEITRWVAGGQRPQSRKVDLEQLTIIPEGDSWQPGDTAELLVQSPFADAHGLAVITRTGIDRTIAFEFDETGAATLRVPITEDDIPGIGVQIEAVGAAPRSATGRAAGELPPRPAFAAGQISLPVPPDTRTLTVDVAPRHDRLDPGGDTAIDVVVRDSTGEAVADAELLVVVVDEAVLSLTGYELLDPLSRFYPNTGGHSQPWRGRATLLLSDPSVDHLESAGGDADFAADDEAVEESAMATMEMADDAGAPAAARAFEGDAVAQDGGAETKAIELRTDFEPLAVFDPQVNTDAQGRATVAVPLPDNLTRYRVMVVATAEATDAGTGESNITARLPITVRPTPPRFANFGDRFEFPVVVQNATDDDLDIDVALRATNLDVDGRAGTTVRVPANDRVEVRFDVAADQAGTARWQVAAASGAMADAAEGSFPVYTPATAEAFATYGVIDQGSIAQPFEAPAGVFPQFGGLEVSTSSTAVAALTDAVLYMHDYRFQSSDAYASRVIAIIALDDVLAAFEAPELPSPDELRTRVQTDIERLAAMQNSDGGFPWWIRGRDSIPYNSVQATHALVLARDQGYDVPNHVLENALWYLAHVEDHMPGWYSPETVRSIGAYAVHVRFLAGDRDVNKASGIYERAAGEQLDVAAWLWPILADTPIDDEIAALFNNRVTETANAATFATSYGEDQWVVLHSDRRTDAIILDALLRMRPDSDLVVKTVNGLLAARNRSGYWGNVQENSFVLLAGSAYFEAFEDVEPAFLAQVWLGDTYAAEHEHQGRTTDNNLTVVPMSLLVADDARSGQADEGIVVAKQGDGRLYYRLGLRYAPVDFELEARDQGFVVQRTYEAIDDPGDVRQDDDGNWIVRAGARVRVRVTMVADSRRTHVALIDPMPAGFEAVNPALATSEPVPQADPSDAAARPSYWWYRWFDHQNLRDDRAEAFATWLGAGSYEYTWVARATTPGTFVVPPARAEQIYEPEVFGRSPNTQVTIAD